MAKKVKYVIMKDAEGNEVKVQKRSLLECIDQTLDEHPKVKAFLIGLVTVTAIGGAGACYEIGKSVGRKENAIEVFNSDPLSPESMEEMEEYCKVNGIKPAPVTIEATDDMVVIKKVDEQ